MHRKERTAIVRTALARGVPLWRIEERLDLAENQEAAVRRRPRTFWRLARWGAAFVLMAWFWARQG